MNRFFLKPAGEWRRPACWLQQSAEKAGLGLKVRLVGAVSATTASAISYENLSPARHGNTYL